MDRVSVCKNEGITTHQVLTLKFSPWPITFRTLQKKHINSTDTQLHACMQHKSLSMSQTDSDLAFPTSDSYFFSSCFFKIYFYLFIGKWVKSKWRGNLMLKSKADLWFKMRIWPGGHPHTWLQLCRSKLLSQEVVLSLAVSYVLKG